MHGVGNSKMIHHPTLRKKIQFVPYREHSVLPEQSDTVHRTYTLYSMEQSPFWKPKKVLSYPRNSPHFMQSKRSLPHSQEPAMRGEYAEIFRAGAHIGFLNLRRRSGTRKITTHNTVKWRTIPILPSSEIDVHRRKRVISAYLVY
jgi:hypothetical protein